MVNVQLPASVRPFPGTSRPGEEAPPDSRPTVVLAEADDEARERIGWSLADAGFDVLSFASGTRALTAIREGAPDIILSGVIMDGTDGLTLLHEVRAAWATRDVPFILLTTAFHHTTAGFDLGADDCALLDSPGDEIVARAWARVARTASRHLPGTAPKGLVEERVFREELEREVLRVRDGLPAGTVAVLGVAERQSLRERMGTRGERQVLADVARLAGLNADPRDLVTIDNRGRVVILAPSSPEGEAVSRLERLARLVAAHTFRLGDHELRLTPAIGFKSVSAGESAASQIHDAELAFEQAAPRMDLVPARFEPTMRGDTSVSRSQRFRNALGGLRAHVGTSVQFLATAFIGLVAPGLAYWGLDAMGFDITGPMYLAVVVVLLGTGALILGECTVSLRGTRLPGEAPTDFPRASAIIAAYLPNEAATIVDTVHAFQRVDYPGPLQIIVAFNSPVRLPVQDELHLMASADPRLVILEIEGSTSKAQNVNAALAHVSGEFVGIFDADHHPQPGSFQRAWRWLANGYDVVQGHPVVRNGDVNRVGKTIAVEFEAIYSVAHPGRARMHGFGLFGGSNGFWRSDALRQVRMRPTMLTEDIDASLRAVLRGYRIGVDPGLVSTELSPVSLKALWHQRMRWAQGWTQCSLTHLRPALRSRVLSPRQKLGMIHLLGWRELYPWISLQMFPIVGYWSWKAGGPQNLDWFVPVFVATSVATLMVGPMQAMFAYWLADPEIRRHRAWFVAYVFVSTIAYTEMKNIIGRIAHVREFLKMRQWKVTPRSKEQVTEKSDRMAA